MHRQKERERRMRAWEESWSPWDLKWRLDSTRFWHTHTHTHTITNTFCTECWLGTQWLHLPWLLCALSQHALAITYPSVADVSDAKHQWHLITNQNVSNLNVCIFKLHKWDLRAMEEEEVNNALYFSLFLTLNYWMTSNNWEYSAWVIWTHF